MHTREAPLEMKEEVEAKEVRVKAVVKDPDKHWIDHSSNEPVAEGDSRKWGLPGGEEPPTSNMNGEIP
eukprot:10303802-Prorocentrum_lima.AAC.1